MTTSRPAKGRRAWTWADHQENERQIQHDADRQILDKLGRLVRLRRGELAELLLRFFDARIDAAFQRHLPPLPEQISRPDTADAVRGAVVELIFDDLVEIINTIKPTRKRNERVNTSKTPPSGESDTPEAKRPIRKG